MLFTVVLTPKLNACVSMTITILLRLLWPCLYSEILLNFTQKGWLLGLSEEKSFVLAQLSLLHKARQSPTVPEMIPLADQGRVNHIWSKHIGQESQASNSVPLESNFRNLYIKTQVHTIVLELSVLTIIKYVCRRHPPQDP